MRKPHWHENISLLSAFLGASVAGITGKARTGMDPDRVEVFPALSRRHIRGAGVRNVRSFGRVPNRRPRVLAPGRDDHFVEAVHEDAAVAVRAEPGRVKALAQPRLVTRMTGRWPEIIKKNYGGHLSCLSTGLPRRF